jgi:hypothetical protein
MAKATTNTVANLARESQQISNANDSIVIVNALGDIPGGRTLDMTGFTAPVRAGHVIIEVSGVYKPMPVNSGGTAYGTLPSGGNYVGVLRYSVDSTDPRAAIVTIGQVNQAACQYAPTSAMKTALPRIEWLYADA